MLEPRIQVNAIKTNPLLSYWYVVHEGADDSVETIAVHTQAGWSIAQTYDSGQDHATLSSKGVNQSGAPIRASTRA